MNTTVSFTLLATDPNVAKITALITGAAAATTPAPAAAAATTAPAVSMAVVKRAMTKAKKEHGEDFCLDVLVGVGQSPKPTLAIGRQLSAIAEENYGAVMAAFAAGPVDDDDDDDTDDDDEDDDTDDDTDDDADGEITAEVVMAALRAHSKEHSRAETKAILKKHKLKAADLDDASTKQLTKLMQAIS